MKPLEAQLQDALEALGGYDAPPQSPPSVDLYDEGCETAAEIAAAALRVLNLAKAILDEREYYRADYIADLVEKATPTDELYGVKNTDFL